MTACSHSNVVVERWAVPGMTDVVRLARLEAALRRTPGVIAVEADLRSRTATIERDRAVATLGLLRTAGAHAETPLIPLSQAGGWRTAPRPALVGLLAAAGLLGFYLGAIALAQGWTHAVDQFRADRWFIAALTAGFGVQAALFTLVRLRRHRVRTSGIAASTGTSTAAMLACCAHHVSELLPILGLSGAALFLNEYKTEMLWLGIAMNIVGIGYMLRSLSGAHTRRMQQAGA